MKPAWLPILALAALAACSMQPPAAPIVATFACPGLGDVVARFRDDDAVFTVAGRDIVLPRALSGSGARYQQGDTRFREHQGEATIDIGSRTYQGCKPKAMNAFSYLPGNRS
jgi:membrane-bound inhibitor of C-type lysozyme